MMVSCTYYFLGIFPVFQSQWLPYQSESMDDKKWKKYFRKYVRPCWRYITRYKLNKE